MIARGVNEKNDDVAVVDDVVIVVGDDDDKDGNNGDGVDNDDILATIVKVVDGVAELDSRNRSHGVEVAGSEARIRRL